MQPHIWDVEEEGNVGEVLECDGWTFFMTLALHDLAHQCILTNTTLMSPWLEQIRSNLFWKL